MNESTEIKINLSSTHWEQRYPGARVYINDQLIFENLIKEPTEINHTADLAEGEHKIIIEMYNKKPGDTETDDNNNITNDVVLNIDGISLEEIELDRLLWTKSIYYPTDEHAPERLDDCVNLGWNGRWELEFSSPIYLWLLENI
jgi:hypothetical protein